MQAVAPGEGVPEQERGEHGRRAGSGERGSQADRSGEAACKDGSCALAPHQSGGPQTERLALSVMGE